MSSRYTHPDSLRPNHQVNFRLFGFVLASIALHLTLLLSHQNPTALSESHQTTMQVTLGAITPTKNPTQIKSVTTKTAKQTSNTPVPEIQQNEATHSPIKNKQRPTELSKNETITSMQQHNVTIENTEQPQLNVSTTDNENMAESAKLEPQRISITQQLKRALANQFHYPLLARKRGWNGTVFLAFSINTYGGIINARIEQGSGHALLDRAALNSLNKVNAVDAKPTQELSFEIPIIYALNGA